MKKLLLINDLPGYGKVALAAMMPVLTNMGYNIYNLPTALVSNTLEYGKFELLETTDYMRNSLAVWKELGFSFDAVATGFIVSQEQVKIISDYCREQSKRGIKVFCDPIMGDEGVLYCGVSEKTVDLMRQLCSVSDYILPNLTEAAFLSGVPYSTVTTRETVYDMIERLRALGAKSVVVTSVKTEDGDSVICYDHTTDKIFEIPFDAIPVRFPGTGDIFSAVFMGNILSGTSFYDSVKKAMDVVRTLISLNRDRSDKFKGIPLEAYLEVLGK